MQAQMTYTAPPPLPMTAAEWAARIVVRHPTLAQPVALALHLAETGHVHTDGPQVQVESSDGRNTYTLRYVEATGAWLCTCPAFRYRPYYVGPVAYCKHTLARAIAARADKHHHLRVTAIHRERNRHASSDEPWTKTPVAFFTDGRHETRHAITDDQYDQLAAIATDDDYHDHDYIAYNQPIQWHDVFSEDRA